jgi:hypothetical protein
VNPLEMMSPALMLAKNPKVLKAMSPLAALAGKMDAGGTVPKDGKYILKAGEKVTATKAPGKTMIFAGADRPMRPMPTNRECVPHQDVEAMPNSPTADGQGHWEIDGDSVKFVK